MESVAPDEFTAGPKGDKGDPGADGAPGADGIDGEDGDTGAPGVSPVDEVLLLQAKVKALHRTLVNQRLRTAFMVFLVVVVLFGLYRTQQVATQIQDFQRQTCADRREARSYIRERQVSESVDWSPADQADQDARYGEIICRDGKDG